MISVILLKIGVCFNLYYNGKKIHSKTLLVSFKESFTDLISSIIVLIVSVLFLFSNSVFVFKYADQVGSIFISFIIFKIFFDIIAENICYLLVKTEEDEGVQKEISDYLDFFSEIKEYHIQLIWMGKYYNLYLGLMLEEHIQLKEMFALKQKIKSNLKRKRLKVRFIEFDIKPYEIKK